MERDGEMKRQREGETERKGEKEREREKKREISAGGSTLRTLPLGSFAFFIWSLCKMMI